jgi:hypothetical protein
MKIVTEQSSPLTPMQLALYATVGALMGALDVHLDAKGARVDRHSARPIFLPWPVDSPFATLLSRHFLVAAAASGTLFKEPNDFFNLQDSGLKPQALAALWASPEFSAVMNVGSESDSRYAWQQAIESMEFGYLTRLILMQRDAYHWKSMQPRGSIIDWPLLCIWTAHLRSSKLDVKVLETAPANAAGRFIRELAAELSRQH